MSMRRLVLFIILATGLNANAVAGPSYVSADNGIGIALGEPGGLTFFHKLNDQYFIQGFLSRDLLVGADYAFVFNGAIHAIPELNPFIGAGAFVFTNHSWDQSRDRSGMGVRIPLGLLLQVPNAPVQFHAEITPSCTVIPFIDSFADAMIGVRFLF